MSKQWTDEDVVKMLGWEFDEYTDAYETPSGGFLDEYTHNAIAGVPPFGLSTPPSAEADANAARYVLPWLEENIDSLGYVCFTILFLEGVDVTLIQYGDDPLDESQDILLKASDDHFCKALCIAALEAYHAGRKDDAK